MICSQMMNNATLTGIDFLLGKLSEYKGMESLIANELWKK